MRSRKAQIERIDVNEEHGPQVIHIMIWAFLLTGGIVMMKFVFQTVLNGIVLFPPEVRVTLLAERFVSSSDCLAYQDSFRVYPGIIDWKKFEDNKAMDGCFTADENGKAFRLTLTKDGERRSLTTRNWANLKISYTSIRPVLVYYSGNFIPGSLTIEMHNEEKQ